VSGTAYKQIGSLCALAAVFIAVSYFAQRYHTQLGGIIGGGGALGIAGFIALTAVFVIFVIPLDIVFLIPVGAAVFGPVPTALMSIAGWTLGAAAAFGIARRFGRPVVEKLIGLGRVRAVERRIPQRHLFWGVVALRMLVSVDILSYALGFASEMPWGAYVAATALGVAPFGFFFAYAGTLPLWWRVLAVAGAVLLATAVFVRWGIAREP
jgi:uncharacterized membrane protein YdjX (TVP38/TMEM64 family)